MHAEPGELGSSFRALRVRCLSANALFGLRRVSSVHGGLASSSSAAAAAAGSSSSGVTVVTPEFARAYLRGRRRLHEGALKFPVVRSAADGTIVDCGNVYEWRRGVAARVVAGELMCSVVTFVRNQAYDPTDIASVLFTEYTIQGRAASTTAEGRECSGNAPEHRLRSVAALTLDGCDAQRRHRWLCRRVSPVRRGCGVRWRTKLCS
jgi:hypothetical protein